MPISPIQMFSLDHPIDADEYLEALLNNPDYRNIEEIERRANALISDHELRARFMTKAQAALAPFCE